MNYYLGDPHFHYEEMITRCNRPFTSVDEMNQTIIDNINGRCTSEDKLIIVGDVSVGEKYVVPLLRQINCEKILVIGNHDRIQLGHKSFRDCFESFHEALLITDGEYDLFISHFPHAEWDGYYKGRFHFYGHVHNSKSGGAALMSLLPTAVNTCADVNNFAPQTADELISKRLKEFANKSHDMDALLDNILHPVVDDRATKKLDMAKLFGI